MQVAAEPFVDKIRVGHLDVQAQVVTRCGAEILAYAKISLRSRYGGMPKRNLNLLEGRADCVRKLRISATEIMRRQILYSNSAGVLRRAYPDSFSVDNAIGRDAAAAG